MAWEGTEIDGIDEAFRMVQEAEAGAAKKFRTFTRENSERCRKITQAVMTLINAPDWDAAKAVLREHADLLLDLDALLLFIATTGSRRGDKALAEVLERRYGYLLVCREYGVEEAIRLIDAESAGPPLW